MKSHAVQQLSELSFYIRSALLKWISQSFLFTVLYFKSWSSIRDCTLDSFLTKYELKMSTTDEVQLLMGIWSVDADTWVNVPEAHVVWTLRPRRQLFCSTSHLPWGGPARSRRCHLSLLSQNFVFLQSVWFSGFKARLDGALSNLV